MKPRLPTLLDHAILGLLLAGPRSGYDVRKVFAETPMGHYSDSTGAIYPALKRLEGAGLVRGRVDDSTPLRPRKVYRLTSKGRKALERWLREPIDSRAVERQGGGLELRLAFIDQMLGPEDVAAFLQRWCEEQRTFVGRLVAHLETNDHLLTGTARDAFELGIAQQRARLRWLSEKIRIHQKEMMA